MTREPIEFLSGVLLVSADPQRLAAFYRDVVGVPLREEQHGDSRPHWGCTLGEIHFAIHPLDTFPDRRSGVGAVKLAFTVFDVANLMTAFPNAVYTFAAAVVIRRTGVLPSVAPLTHTAWLAAGAVVLLRSGQSRR